MVRMPYLAERLLAESVADDLNERRAVANACALRRFQ